MASVGGGSRGQVGLVDASTSEALESAASAERAAEAFLASFAGRDRWGSGGGSGGEENGASSGSDDDDDDDEEEEEAADEEALVPSVLVHYNGWPARWDEWLPMDSPRLAPFRTRTSHPRDAPFASPTPQAAVRAAPRTPLGGSTSAAAGGENSAGIGASSGGALGGALGGAFGGALGGASGVGVGGGGGGGGADGGGNDVRSVLPEVVTVLGQVGPLLAALQALCDDELAAEARDAATALTTAADEERGGFEGQKKASEEAGVCGENGGDEVAGGASSPAGSEMAGAAVSRGGSGSGEGSGDDGGDDDGGEDGGSSCSGGSDGGPRSLDDYIFGDNAPPAAGAEAARAERRAEIRAAARGEAQGEAEAAHRGVAPRAARPRNAGGGGGGGGGGAAAARRGNIALLSRGLGPVCDRLGRLMADLAPHLGALADRPAPAQHGLGRITGGGYRRSPVAGGAADGGEASGGGAPRRSWGPNSDSDGDLPPLGTVAPPPALRAAAADPAVALAALRGSATRPGPALSASASAPSARSASPFGAIAPPRAAAAALTALATPLRGPAARQPRSVSPSRSYRQLISSPVSAPHAPADFFFTSGVVVGRVGRV